MASNAPTFQIFKFDTVTTTDTVHAITTNALSSPTETGIKFNLQIVEKGSAALSASSAGSTVVGNSSDEINSTTSQDLANIITRYFKDKSIMSATTDANGDVTRNIRSMKLIVDIDPSA